MKRAVFAAVITALAMVSLVMSGGGSPAEGSHGVFDVHVHDDFFHPTGGFVVGPDHTTAQALCQQPQPDTLCTAVIHAGDSIRWVSPAPLAANIHSVTECADNNYNSCGTGASSGPIDDSGLRAPPDPGPSDWPYEVQFDNPGIFYYRCEVHPDVMRGVVQVLAPNGAPGAVGGIAGLTGGEPASPAADEAGGGIKWLAVALAAFGGFAIITAASVAAVRVRSARRR